MTEDQADLIDFGRPWRVGRSLGRTLYVAADDDPDRHIVFGMVDNPELARHIVRIHNEWLAARQWDTECAEFGCCEQESDQT